MRLKHSIVTVAFGLVLMLGAESDATEEEESAAQNDFFQKHFEKFVPIRFEKDEDGYSRIQRLNVNSNIFVYNGERYCGFRFMVPDWLDGDFEWFFILAKTEAQKDFVTDSLWYIVPEHGHSEGFESFESNPVSSHYNLQKLFPYTHNITNQSLSQKRLKPGSNYAIWFRIYKENEPDIAFAMTIKSKRGALEYGELPLGTRFDSHEMYLEVAKKAGDQQKVKELLGEELGLAVNFGAIGKVKSLLAQHADVNYGEGKPNMPAPPLLLAARLDRLEIFEMLLPKDLSQEKINALFTEAIRNGASQVSKVLLDRGADVHRLDKESGGLLRSALPPNSPETVRLLLDKGATVGLQDALDLAENLYNNHNRNFAEVIDLLKKAGATSTERIGAVSLPRLDVLPPVLETTVQRVFPVGSDVKAIVALCHYRDTLWISAQSSRRLGGERDWNSGFLGGLDHLFMPASDSKVWTLDLTSNKLTDMSPLMGKRSKVTSFCPRNERMWMTLAEDGVWCIDLASLKITKYGPRDGVATGQMFASTAVGDRMYFGGGAPNRGLLSVFDTQTSTWTSEEIGGGGSSAAKTSPGLGPVSVAHVTTNTWRRTGAAVAPAPSAAIWNFPTPPPDHPLYDPPKRPRIGCLGTFPQRVVLEVTLDDPDRPASTGSPFPLAIFDVESRKWVAISSNLFGACPRILQPIGPNGNCISRPCLWAAASDQAGIWMATSVGLFFLNLDTMQGKSLVSPPGMSQLRYDATSNTMVPMRKVTLDASRLYQRSVNCVRPTTRLPGLVTALAHDGEFLWLATTTAEDGFAPQTYELRPHYLLLLHKPSQQWVGQVRIPHRANTIAVSSTHVWVGLEDNDNSRDYGALIGVEKKSLLDIPCERWISDQIPDDEIANKLKQFPVLDQARYAFLMGQAEKVIQLLGGEALSKCGLEALFLLGYSYDPLGVNKPVQARRCFEEVLRRKTDELLQQEAKKALLGIAP